VEIDTIHPREYGNEVKVLPIDGGFKMLWDDGVVVGA
jgi:hypothetical protein